MKILPKLYGLVADEFNEVEFPSTQELRNVIDCFSDSKLRCVEAI
jgi:hypothetical protein